ncbi:MAG: hypothetical protein MK066_10755 [Crocinitomicaceae bacterium]|nr:hypothetical protein [Crocinitomicaceae bacterium]
MKAQTHDFSEAKYIQWALKITAETPIIIDKIAKSCSMNEKESNQVLIEALKYLDLVYFSGQMLTPSILVDYAWHEFILCTKSYANFCEKHFGKFIHHHPGGRTKETISRFRKTMKYYIMYIGEPKEKYWGEQASIEWLSSQCGSCTSL